MLYITVQLSSTRMYSYEQYFDQSGKQIVQG